MHTLIQGIASGSFGIYSLAVFCLVLAFFISIYAGSSAVYGLCMQKNVSERRIEKAHNIITVLVTISCFILLMALVNNDFSVRYVASYTDRNLPIFYRVTAFWAGQEGSLLFWAWSVIFCGSLFMFSKSYDRLKNSTKIWFWIFFMLISCFFLLLLITWSNPFELLTGGIPDDGQGLNPLLQHPGMVFHPPLLFLGYGGFVIPGCLALAQSMSRKRSEEGSWVNISRPFTLSAWMFLSAGIILGAWWAYMELGWGGYWAWDPVENASLIPWLVATASIHISILETRRGKLFKLNVILMAMTTISAFFATYLVRSGVVQSLHAFSGSKVGLALLIFVLAAIVLSVIIAVLGEKSEKPLGNFLSREGLLIFVAFFLLVISLLILIATMWPVFTDFFQGISSGLDAEFYNQVCLPIFIIMLFPLAFCPWVNWKGAESGNQEKLTLFLSFFFLIPIIILKVLTTTGLLDEALFPSPVLLLIGVAATLLLAFSAMALTKGVRNRNAVIGILLTFTGTIIVLKLACGVQNISVIIAISVASATVVSIILLSVLDRKMLKLPSFVGANGIHLGLIFMVLGIALSGPYKEEQTFVLSPGDAISFKEYRIGYKTSYDGTDSGYTFFEAKLEIMKGDNTIGFISPQRRFYAKSSMPSIKSATRFSLGTELYTSILDCDLGSRAIKLHVSAHPLVNWIWIGGIMLCVFPIISILPARKRDF